jgi:predicted nucleic acid-binding protein
MGPSPAPLPAGIHVEEKDRPVLAAAIEIRATHFLTGDKTHFGRYYGRLVGGVRVLTPAEYLRSGK